MKKPDNKAIEPQVDMQDVCKGCGATFIGPGHKCVPQIEKDCEIAARLGSEILREIAEQHFRELNGPKRHILEMADEFDRQVESIKAKDELIYAYEATHFKDLYELGETVQLTCSPPNNCDDPVVLKQYMKAAFDKSMELVK